LSSPAELIWCISGRALIMPVEDCDVDFSGMRT
jgi:hypothetical protein